MDIPPRLHTEAPPEIAIESPHKGLTGARRIMRALVNSLAGLAMAWRIESAFRQEVVGALILLPLALALRVTAVERVLLVGSVLLVLIIELLNSSVEAAIDRISLDHHRLSKRAKDLGSAAVLVALVLLMITWGSIAGPALMTLFA
jgi:diacylglycerol kinase (ATP)